MFLVICLSISKCSNKFWKFDTRFFVGWLRFHITFKSNIFSKSFLSILEKMSNYWFFSLFYFTSIALIIFLLSLLYLSLCFYVYCISLWFYLYCSSLFILIIFSLFAFISIISLFCISLPAFNSIVYLNLFYIIYLWV